MAFFSGNVLFNIIAAIAFIFTAVYLYFKYCYTYWQKIGIPYLEPKFPFGNFEKAVKSVQPFGQVLVDYYNVMKKHGHRYFGIYFFNGPAFVAICPDLLKNIMLRDFAHFYDRGVYHDEENDPLTGHLFSLEGQKWKNLRAKLTPTFTSGKLKKMFQTLVDCSMELKDCLKEYINTGEPINIKQILDKYTTDVIGSCAFGIDCNSFKNPNTDFIKLGNLVFKPAGLDRIKLFLTVIAPRIMKFFKMQVTNKDVDRFYRNLVKETIEFRENNNITRNDFMQLLIQLKNEGIIEDDECDHEIKNRNDTSFTINELAAQAFLFFVAGFETSSTTMTWCLFELAQNEEIQNKLRAEIVQVLKKYNGKISYDGIMEMCYMDRVIYETMRKYPPIMIIQRIVTKDYNLNENIILKKGTIIFVPVLAIHRDPEYYPNSDKFDPDRFTEENKGNRPDCTWLPFGEGPRICIGLRFGMMQIKVGLCQLLLNYKLTLSSKTVNPPILDASSMVCSAKDSIWLNAEKIVN